MSKIKIFIINLLIFIILILIIFELILPRFIAVPHLIYYNWENRPVTFYPNFKHRAVTNDYDIKFRSNSLGFKDIEHDHKNKKIKTILLLGDSYIQSSGVDPKSQLSRKLEKIAKLKNYNIRVISMGMSGYGQNEQYINYNILGINYNPDIVITFFCPNDIKDNIRTKGLYFDKNLKIILTKKEKEFDLNQFLVRNFLSRFETYHIYKKIIRDIYKFTMESEKKLIKVNHEKNLKQKDISRTFGDNDNNVFPLIESEIDHFKNVIKQIKKDVVIRDNKKLLNVIVSAHVKKKPSQKYLEFLKMIDNIFYNLEIPNINTDQIFRSEYKYKNILPHWEHDVHWNKEGNNRVAELIFEKIENWI